MRTQQDTKVRMVALDNLVAMCNHISSVCHVYRVESVSRSRVRVTYSNPDEYGNDRPITAIFPCYPSGWDDDTDNPRVVLDPLRLIGPDADWDMFYPLESCPTLWRSNGETDDWRTHADVLKDRGQTTRGNDINGRCVSCVVCDVKD